VEERQEQELVSRLRQGDGAAFDRIYEAFRPRVFSFLARLCGRRDLAEDLLQETWLRLASQAPELREDTRLGPWLFTVARNLFISQWRRQRYALDRQGELEGQQALSPGWISPFDLAAAGETERALERALAALPLSSREVILLVAIEHLEIAEVARALSLSPEAVRQRLSRARAQLAEHLATLEGRKETRQ
jgi:RNA polymerase sigma-70 factor (ECF subfamily)